MGYINTSIFVLLFDRLLFRQLLQLFVEPFFVVVRPEFAGSLLEAFELTFAFGHAAFLNMHNFTVFIDESGADFVASGLKMGLEHTQYGFTEHRYAKALVPRTYERAGNYLSYGLKFFPSAPHETNAFMHWVYKHCRG